MKNLIIALALAALSSTLCRADNIHEFTLIWNVAGSGNQISLQTSNGGKIISSFAGTFSNIVPTASCNSTCTFLATDFQVSGLTASNVIYKSALYSTVYFSGSLDIRTNIGQNGPGLTAIVGNLEACSDPSCTHSLFTLPVDGLVLAHPHLQFTLDSSGQPILTSADFHTTPEPSDLALVGTGCLFLLGRVRRGTKR